MRSTIVLCLGIVLLLVSLALTQVSSPDYRWIMTASLVCALGALAGFLIGVRGRSGRWRIALSVLAAFCGCLALYALVAIVSMGAKH